MKWCDAVKRYQNDNFGDRGNCGFLKDETTGSQKIIFETLPTEVKLLVEKMAVGAFSQPRITASQDGTQVFRIFYLKDFIAPHEASLTQDYGRIQVEAEASKKQEVVETWVEGARKRMYIRFMTEFYLCPDLQTWENRN
jgi:hypothetical protein